MPLMPELLRDGAVLKTRLRSRIGLAKGRSDPEGVGHGPFNLFRVAIGHFYDSLTGRQALSIFLA